MSKYKSYTSHYQNLFKPKTLCFETEPQISIPPLIRSFGNSLACAISTDSVLRRGPLVASDNIYVDGGIASLLRVQRAALLSEGFIDGSVSDEPIHIQGRFMGLIAAMTAMDFRTQ